MLRPVTIPFSPQAFIRQWMAMMPAPATGDARFDYEGFTSALVELVSDEEWSQTTSDRMESAAAFVLEVGDGGLVRLFEELAGSREFTEAAKRVAWAFDRQEGLDPAVPEAAAVRRDLLRQFAESLSVPFEEHRERRQENRARAERRLYSREPIITDLLPREHADGDDENARLTAPGHEPDPSCAVAGRECAARVLAIVRAKIRPAAFAALGIVLATADERPACEVARERGISPATLTRAMKLLASIARAEVVDLPTDAISTFHEVLITGLRPVA